MPYSKSPNTGGNSTVINMGQSPSSDNDMSRPSMPRSPHTIATTSNVSTTASHMVKEYRNIIRHILSKIHKRRRPPTALAQLAELYRLSALSSDDPVQEFDHDDTVDLLIQLRTSLMLCEKHELGPDILYYHERGSGGSSGNGSTERGPMSHSNSYSPLLSSSPRSPSGVTIPPQPSPATETDQSFMGPSSRASRNRTIFDNILALLDDLVLNDARYKNSNPRPSRPPYILQHVLIDIATLLVALSGNDVVSMTTIGQTMLPAFDSINDGPLLGKLLGFYVDVLLPRLQATTEQEQQQQQEPESSNSSSGSKRMNGERAAPAPAAPTINIQSADDNVSATSAPPPVPSTFIHDPPSSSSTAGGHLTINTNLSPKQSSPSPATTSHSITHLTARDDQHRINALFAPLLYFMIQYLDPYLSACSTSTTSEESPLLAFTISRQNYSIYNFHRAIQYMMRQKPDIYLDMLDVMGHAGAPEVRFRACQLLFHYYSISTGHVVVAEGLPPVGQKEELNALEKLMAQQDYEQARHQHHQQHTDPTFLETMMGGTSTGGSNPTLNVAGINRRYRASMGLPPLASSQQGPLTSSMYRYREQQHQQQQQQQQEQQQFYDDGDMDIEGDQDENASHVWHPHMFAEHDNDEQVVAPTVQRLSTTAAYTAAMHNDMSGGAYCKECYKSIRGFGLRCYQCKCSLHYGCLATADNDLGIMLYVKEGGIQKVVSPQFCHIVTLPRLRDVYGDRRQAAIQLPSVTPSTVDLLGHHFHLVNLYTLILCASCRQPLWGISYQGYRCTICNRFVHPHCLAEAAHEHGFKHDLARIQTCQPYQPLLESDTIISHNDIVESLHAHYGDLIPKSERDLDHCTFEEVGLMLNVLLLQDNILQCGIAAGSLLVTHPQSEEEQDDLEASSDPLHDPRRQSSSATSQTSSSPPSTLNIMEERVARASSALRDPLAICLARIAAGTCPTSRFFASFYSNRSHSLEECLLSKEEYLAHIAAMMKNNINSSHESTGSSGVGEGLLRVETWNHSNYDDEPGDSEVTCHQVMERETMVQWIMNNLRFKSRTSAHIFLQHMRNLGLFELLDGSHVLFSESTMSNPEPPAWAANLPTQCIFPVPYAIDTNSNTKLDCLVDAIDACLADIDITINECGMLLLVRRCWPDPIIPRYTCERLVESILGWIFSEDEKLSTLHAEYLGDKNQRPQQPQQSQQPLPGVRQNRWAQAAQAAVVSRVRGAAGATGHGIGGGGARQSVTFAMGMSSGAGSVYVTTRNALRERYLTRWMSMIHEIDPRAYATMLFDIIDRIVDGKLDESAIHGWTGEHEYQRITAQRFDEAAGYILKLKSCGLAFTAFDPVLQQILDKAFEEFDSQGLLAEKEPVDIRNLAKLCSSKISVARGPYTIGGGLATGTTTPTGATAAGPSTQSSTSSSPATAAAAAAASSPSRTDPSHAFDVITSLFAAGSHQSVERGLRWLEVIMHAGTGIPSTSITKIARHLVEAQATIQMNAQFVKLLWFQAVNILNVHLSRAVIIDVVGYLNEIMLDDLKRMNEDQHLSIDELEHAQKFIKYSVALGCFAYNCPLSNITELDIVPYFGDHIAQLSHNKRMSMHTENTVPMYVDETTPVIHCMLAYLELDQLNVRFDVLKMFYALVHWGFGISNKSDLIAKCAPILTTAIWETLPPCYDHMSDINLNLLMKVMSSDPVHFHACVLEVFEHSSWEVRFEGLDNLYGLFTKMDAAFQTKWLPMLSYLGPVFSYFVGSLWDKEEYVRSKAFSLIRTFGTLHLRSAFRCWEAYFLTANDRQKTSVIKLMTQLSSLFPDWQVIQWESLLEALEAKQERSGEEEENGDRRSFAESVDILERYTRYPPTKHMKPKEEEEEAIHEEQPKAEENQETTQEQEEMRNNALVDSENCKILMVTLALQLLSCHLPVDTIQVSRLKYILVKFMGFQDCHRYATPAPATNGSGGGEWVVSFGNLVYNYSDPLHHSAMVAASRGLKKVVDSFAPLPAETVASMAPDVLERNRVELAENSSPGVHFIDVVLKMFNSGINLTKLSHMMLKTWLETVLIVLYKHNILDRDYEHSIVNCMKQIIELLTKEISEENKLLILEILKCLLRRSDHLTAMVLSKQIMALGKLMTKLGIKRSEPVFLKAKEFLKSAFLRFAVAGLFVLMFKNQTVSDANNKEVDLFFVLGAVIDPEDVVPDEDTREIIYLRDQPVRDVLDKLMKQQMERSAFSTVLHNMSRYVQVVHWRPYPEAILNDYALFLNTLVKHTSNWRRTEWDINPLFTMSAILLKEHPYYFAILLPQIQILFRQGIQNCTIDPEDVVKLLASFSVIPHIPGGPTENPFVLIILEEVKAGLQQRQKLHKDTLLTLLELIYWDSRPEYLEWFKSIENSLPGEPLYRQRQRTPYFDQQQLESSLLEPLMSFLKLPPVSQQLTKKDFKTYTVVSKLLISLCIQDPKCLPRILGQQKLDETRHCLRFLDWFLLAILEELLGTRSSNTDMLSLDVGQFVQPLIVFEDSIVELLVQTFNSIPIDLDTTDMSFSYCPSGETLLLCFLLLKIWVLLTLLQRQRIMVHQQSQAMDKPAFWMSVWPALRRFLGRIDSSTLSKAGSAGSSVWNMFLSLVQYLFVCRSPIVMINAYEWSSLLDVLLQQIPEPDDSNDKDDEQVAQNLKKETIRVRSMFTAPPVEVPVSTLIDQLYLELRDVMRLQAETALFQSSSTSYSNGFGAGSSSSNGGGGGGRNGGNGGLQQSSTTTTITAL